MTSFPSSSLSKRSCFRWSLPHKIFTWIIALFFIWRLVTFAFGFSRLLEIKRFYEFLLDVPNVSLFQL